MKVLANDGIAQSGQDKLEQNGFSVVTETVAQADLVSVINELKFEVLLVRSATKVRKDIIDNCPSLKMIGRGGVGMDNIDVEYAREKGIVVFNTPASSSLAVAELVTAQLFSLARSIYDSNREMPVNGKDNFKGLKKQYGKGIELRGKTLGIIGFGRIGQYTAKYALGLGMNVVAFDPFMEKATIAVEVADQTVNIEIVTSSLDELLGASDFISLHVPMPSDGKALISTAEFSKMKDGVRIVNAARGGVIDEDALIAALESGKVNSVALDVFVNEPTPREDLLANNKIALTPHIGAATLEAQDRIGIELADNIIEFYNK